MESDNKPAKHGALGIASFVIAAVALAMFGIGVIGLNTFDYESLLSSIDDQMSEEELTDVFMNEAPMLIIGILLLLAASFLPFVGAFLGIAGLFFPNRRRLFAILGTTLNGIMVVTVLAIGIAGFLGLF